MGQLVDSNLGKGRLRSAWTHNRGADIPPNNAAAAGNDGSSTPFSDGSQVLHAADYAQHQQLQQLHHTHSSQHHGHPQLRLLVPGGAGQHTAAGGSSAGGGGGGFLSSSGMHHHQDQPHQHPDVDTPRKLNPALTFLQQQQQQLFTNRRNNRALFFTSVDREILCNALACAGASMSDPLMSMVDSYYAGKLGTTALAALGSNGALFSVLYFLCFTALAVLCTQAMASANSRGDSEGCGRGFIQAVAATLVVSSVLVCVLLSMPETLLGMFQTDAEVLALAKTYCMIRALSLPAALSINVSQAAFRSMLDLTTPFCIVMTVNAANYLLNQLLMVIFPYGMAGCGWASVISQYMGAFLFAAVIYRRRHKFGIPEALAGAEDWFYEQRQLTRSPAAANGNAGATSTGGGGGSTLVAKKLSTAARSGGGGGGDGSSRAATTAAGPGSHGGSGSKLSPSKRQHAHAGRAKRHSRTSSGTGGSPRRGISPRRSRESSGTLRIDLTAFEQHLQGAGEGASTAAGADARGDPSSDQGGWGSSKGGGGSGSSSLSPSGGRRRGRSGSGAGLGAGAAAAGDSSQAHGGELLAGPTGSGSIHHRHHGAQQPPWGVVEPVGGFEQQQQQPGQPPFSHSPSPLSGAASAGGGSSGWQQQQQQQHGGASSGGHFQLHRWDSAGSESKLPRYQVGSSSGSRTSWGRLLLLLRSLDWPGFVQRFAGMTTRGMLILSTYTTANLVAANGGTAMMAAHQVVQQQQQLQMSFAWSFLHVGQSMTANLFHSKSALSGPKAARRLSERIVSWAMCSCLVLALGTWTFRHTLPTIFSTDEEVQSLVLSASLPAAIMLGLGWNNALEGCLLAADEQPFVVRTYPCAVAAALMQLARCYWAGSGLPGVWVALMTYYLVLLIGFAARYWVYRGRL